MESNRNTFHSTALLLYSFAFLWTKKAQKVSQTVKTAVKRFEVIYSSAQQGEKIPSGFRLALNSHVQFIVHESVQEQKSLILTGTEGIDLSIYEFSWSRCWSWHSQ